MTSIPLNCNICPKQPEFSDISHLLTHVASKGHLSQQFKAQVRARQDVSIRQKLDAYDRWFEVHHIETLLSERMIAKDSKDTGNRNTADKSSKSKTQPANEIKPRRRRIKTSKQESEEISPVKVEEAIDPQLSSAELPATLRSCRPTNSEESLGQPDKITSEIPLSRASSPVITRSSPVSGLPYPDHSHRTYVPLMSRWQGTTSPKENPTSRTPTGGKMISLSPQPCDSDPENDCFKTFLRSPSRTAYPDPSEITDFHSGFPSTTQSPISKQDDKENVQAATNSNPDSCKELDTMPQSPILKGVKWPGMSLFDSASLEAQRLRNQKKNTSVLEQMESNSALVEQIERIYWPDGSFKKERTITGNVESSPMKEPTPPPKPVRRRRTKTNTTILANVSTNTSLLGRKPRAHRTSSSISANAEPNPRHVSKKAFNNIELPQLAYPRNSHTGHKSFGDGNSKRPVDVYQRDDRKRAFDVFKDPSDSGRLLVPSKTIAPSHAHVPPTRQGLVGTLSPGFETQKPGPSSSNFTSRNALNSPSLGPERVVLAHKDRAFAPGADKENIEPILDHAGKIDDDAQSLNEERPTQRYFSISGNKQPQFFSSMPPGWDFGGLPEPRYHGSTLNPLNLYFSRPQFQSHPSQISYSPAASQPDYKKKGAQ